MESTGANLRERLDQWCVDGIWGLVLAILVFSPLATGAVRAPDFVVVMGLTAGVLALWAVRFWLSGSKHVFWPPIAWAVGAFTLYAAARYGWAEIEYVAREEILRILVYAALFLAVVNNLYGQKRMRVLILALLVVATAISFYAAYQFITGSTKVWHFTRPEVYGTRGSGTFICPNSLAGFLELLLPLAITLTFTKRTPPLQRVFTGYAALAMLAGLAVTFSRGGWLAAGVSLLALLVLAARQRRYWLPLLVGTVVVGVGAYLFMSVAQRTVQRRLEDAKDLGYGRDLRLRLWPAAVKVWRENPWWGVGPAHFDHHYRPYREAVSRTQFRPVYAHNDYLNTLADYGVVGATLVATAWGLLFWGVVRYGRRRCQSGGVTDFFGNEKCGFALGASLGLLALLIHAALDFNFHVPANALLAVTLMALLSTHWRFVTEQFWYRLRVPGKAGATVILLLVGAVLTLAGYRRAQEERWLRAGETALTLAAQIAAWEQAYAREPYNYETAYKLGEAHRAWSWEGDDDYVEQAQKAMRWYERAMELNPRDPYAPLGYGMCLDWLGQHREADPWFDRALGLDPNNYYLIAYMGWHLYQKGQWREAQQWMVRSHKLNWWDNAMANAYYHLIERRLREATNTPGTLSTNAVPNAPP